MNAPPERDLNPPDRPDISESDLADATGELADRIVAGEKIGGIDILACLDCEQDDDKIAFLDDLATFFRTLHQGTPVEFWCRAENYLMRIAMRHVPESAILERASTLKERL